MSDGRIFHAVDDGVHVFRYQGRLDYTVAPELNRCFRRTLGRDVNGLIFDLRDAESIDSTNYGLLARAAQQASRSCNRRPVIVSTNTDVDQFLRSMSFEDLFDIVHELPAEGTSSGNDASTEIESSDPRAEDLLPVMLEAHRFLIELSDENRGRFEQVVACLEAESGSQSSH